MLFAYRQQVQRLLHDTIQARVNLQDVDSYINTARNQTAGEGEAIRSLGTLNTISGEADYLFTAISYANAPVGSGPALAVRQMAFGGKLLTPRTWEWLFTYYIASGAGAGPPVDWAQLSPGQPGHFYLGPAPNTVGVLTLDVVLTPTALVTDADPEALPYPFTDAVPYFAAYLALLAMEEFDAAERHYQLFERFVARARAMSTPTVLPGQYPGGEGAMIASQARPITPPTAPPPGGTR